MAWSASGLMVASHVDKWDDTQLATDITSETDIKAAFWGSSVTPNFTTDLAYGSSPWNSGQSSGAGYTAGGIVVTGTTLVASSGSMKFDADNFSLPNSTITAEGYLLYDHAHSDRALAAVWFGSPQSTQDGTFLVTHDPAGIYSIDLTP
ncbi:hypothetical protein [Streptosporangium sp. NPDC051022]|uniref:hypothetical protein n=1 Tax=Streptosporangium sp. NPDC051022 TaxID=3155752 RepID=UPI0034335EF9